MTVIMRVMGYVCVVYSWVVLCLFVLSSHVLYNIAYVLENRRSLRRWVWLEDVFPMLFKGFCNLLWVGDFHVVYAEVLEVFCGCPFEFTYVCPEFRRSVYSVSFSAL